MPPFRRAASLAAGLVPGVGLALREQTGRLYGRLYDRAYAAYMTDCWSPERAAPTPSAASSSARGSPQPSEDDEVHVVYSTTNTASNYIGLLGSMVSLSRHLEAPARCSIHLLVLEDEMEDAQGLVRCLRRELADLPALPTVRLHELRIGAAYGRLKRLPAMSLGVNSPHSLARFRLHELLPANLSRVIWLDHDTLVRADVGPLYRMRLEQPLAAAFEPRWATLGSYLKYLPQLPEDLRRELRDQAAPVLNIGVLVYDLTRWRAEPLAASCEAWFERVGKAVQVNPFLQLTFNFAFQDGGVDALDWRWNLVGMPPYRPPVWADSLLRLDRLPDACSSEARIFHWAACTTKPWEDEGSEFRGAYPACGALA